MRIISGMRIGKLQIFTLVIIVLILLVNLFYIIDTEDTSVVANINNLIGVSDDSHWVRVGSIELRAFDTEVRLAKGDNPSRLTYSIQFAIRYNKENSEIAMANIDKLRIIKYDDFSSKDNLPYISSATKDVKLEKHLVFVEGPMGKSFRSREGDPKYMYGDFVTLQFNTDVLASKYVEFNAFGGNRFLVKTNPMLVFRSQSVYIYIYILLFILAIISYAYGGFLNSIFMFALIILSLITSHMFIYFLFSIFVIPIIVKIKLQKTSLFKGRTIKFNYKLWSFVFLVFACLVFIFIHNFSRELDSFILIEIITSIIITFMLSIVFFVTAFALSNVYTYLRYQEKNVESVEINNIREELIGTKYRKFPVYKCDIVLNGNITIKDLEMGVITYRRLVNKPYKNTFIKKYKTDGFDNYIFY